jgi:hypothetical protein
VGSFLVGSARSSNQKFWEKIEFTAPITSAIQTTNLSGVSKEDQQKKEKEGKLTLN